MPGTVFTTRPIGAASVVLGLVLTVCGCGGPGAAPTREATVTGNVQVSPGSRGSAWLFMYGPGSGPPKTQAFPEEVTAVPDLRLKDGDTRFLFADVEPNAYRLWAFLDTNLDFQTEIDVLGGPGAGDRIAEGVELNLQPGEERHVDLPISQYLAHEPPAFSVHGVTPGRTIDLPDQPQGIITFDLRADGLGILDAERTAFVVGLGDADGDGVPDDANADNIPDLFPQIYLRFLRRPGQVVPLDLQGNPAEVIVPLTFDPGPFLVTLASDPTREVVVDRLQTAVLPQAQAITFEPGRGRVVRALDAIPVGEYELWVVAESGQWWRMPNDLRTDAAAHLGGPFPGQGVGFRFIHGTEVPGTGPLPGGP